MCVCVCACVRTHVYTHTHTYTHPLDVLRKMIVSLIQPIIRIHPFYPLQQLEVSQAKTEMDRSHQVFCGFFYWWIISYYYNIQLSCSLCSFTVKVKLKTVHMSKYAIFLQKVYLLLQTFMKILFLQYFKAKLHQKPNNACTIV